MKRKLPVLTTLLFLVISLTYAQNKTRKIENSGILMSSQKTILKKERVSLKTKQKNNSSTLSNDSNGLKSSQTGEYMEDAIGAVKTSHSTEAGTTVGSLSVSLTGAATYTIPVMVPPGIKEVAPTLSLSYSSQASNGLAGWGWNVSGLSTITRIAATNYYDKKHDGVDFQNDRFAIDGQRLILKSGTYGASGSVYQTENYSNIKVVAYGSSPYGSTYGPSYFVVFYPNGARAWYGNSGNSRSRLEWAIFRWQDPQGNYVDYQYQSDHGLLSIKSIKYGGRIGSSTATNQIYFTYETRKRPENLYIGDFSFKRTNLLKSIQVTAKGSQYRKYELTHSTTSIGYQRVSAVKEYNAKNKVLNPIIFKYGSKNNNALRVSKTSLSPNFDPSKHRLFPGDFDGDGTMDLVMYDKSSRNKLHVSTHISDKSNKAAKTYSIATKSFIEIFPSVILSANNKILSQQAITTVENFTSYSSSKSTLRFKTFSINSNGKVYQQNVKEWSTMKYRTQNWCGSASVYHTIPRKYISGDFNGDGLTDVLAIEREYTSSTCRRVTDCGSGNNNTGGGNGNGNGNGGRPDQIRAFGNESNLDPAIQVKRPIEPDCCNCSGYTQNRNYAKVHFIDLNRNKTTNFAKVSGYFRTGISLKDRIQVGDFNGDGKQDLYHFKEGKLYVYTLNEANDLVMLKEESDTDIKLKFPILLGDFNGDGKTDFIIPTENNNSTWKHYLSTGKKHIHKKQSSGIRYYEPYEHLHRFPGDKYPVKAKFEYHYLVSDYNKDGKSDLIVHANITAIYSAKNNNHMSVDISTISSTNDYFPKFEELHSVEGQSGSHSERGIPMVMDIRYPEYSAEYMFISSKGISSYGFNSSHQNEITLESLTNNGVTTNINYQRMGIGANYTADYSQNYPYVNINIAPSFKLVAKLTEEGAGIKRYQDFFYHGAVSNINIGFQGFLKTKRSNWYGDNVGKLWTISKYDPTKKGAVTEQWVSASFYEGNSYISKTTNSYSSSLASTKVFTNIPLKVVQHNALNRTTTTKNYTYDTYKNVLTESTTYQGGSNKVAYTYSNNISTSSQSYHVGRLTKKVTTNTVGGNAFTTEEQYSYNNNLVTQQKVKGIGTPWNIESFTYDAFGNVTQKTLTSSGVSSRTEKFKYDTSGRFLTESTDIEGLKTTFTYDVFGNPLATKNPFNQVTKFTYDGWNRLIQEENYLKKITKFYYDHLGSRGTRHRIDYPQGKDEAIYYNVFGWETQVGSISLGNQWHYVKKEYDVAGRERRISEPFSGSPSQWNTTAYDIYGRVISKTNFNGLVARVSYNGLTTSVDDGTKTVKTTKDGGGNIVKMEDPGGAISYTYFGNGVMKSANYGSHVVKTEIDGWGRKIKLVDPSAGTYTYTHNNLGALLEQTTPKGKTTYTYDAFGKVTTKKVSGDETNLSLNYTYNTTTKLLTAIQGKNARTNESYSYKYEYDTHKRISVTSEQNGKAYFENRVT